MQRVYVCLDPATAKALASLAWANRRHPKDEAALIITRYLRKRGLLQDGLGIDKTPDTVTLGGGAAAGDSNPQLTSKEVRRDLTS